MTAVKQREAKYQIGWRTVNSESTQRTNEQKLDTSGRKSRFLRPFLFVYTVITIDSHCHNLRIPLFSFPFFSCVFFERFGSE